MLTHVQRQRCLTSAAGDCGIQAGALGDVDLDHFLSTGWVDADSLQQVGICCSTPTETVISSNTASGWGFYCFSLSIDYEQTIKLLLKVNIKIKEILSYKYIIRIYQTYFKLKAKPCVTSPAFGPVKCRPRIFWSPSCSHTTCGSRKVLKYFKTIASKGAEGSYLQITLASITLCNCKFQRFVERMVNLQGQKHKRCNDN